MVLTWTTSLVGKRVERGRALKCLTFNMKQMAVLLNIVTYFQKLVILENI